MDVPHMHSFWHDFPAPLLLLTALISVGAWALQTEAPAASQHEPAIGQKLTVKGLSNLGEVTPFLYRGAQPSPEGLEALAKMGVKVVVNARVTKDRREEQEVTRLGMQYVPIPWHCAHPKDKVFAKFLAILRENPAQKVFVHCELGKDRTGMMIASYRMAEEGWSAHDAMREMQAFGFNTVHHAMCPGLAGFEKQFPERLKDNPELRGLGAKGAGQQPH